MSNNHHAQWIPCQECGTLVLTTAPQTTCEECQDMRAKELRRARYHYKHVEPDAYIVVEDPTPGGAFCKGAVILREHLREMIRPSICAFTAGTILRDKQGNTYKIGWTEKGGQELIPV